MTKPGKSCLAQLFISKLELRYQYPESELPARLTLSLNGQDINKGNAVGCAQAVQVNINSHTRICPALKSRSH